VKARAALIALSTASLPLLEKRIVSNAGERAQICSARSTSISVGRPKLMPRAAAAATAATIFGLACPWIAEKKLLVKSTITLPSTSTMRDPSPWAA
jgi:hypothetical protein